MLSELFNPEIPENRSQFSINYIGSHFIVSRKFVILGKIFFINLFPTNRGDTEVNHRIKSTKIRTFFNYGGAPLNDVESKTAECIISGVLVMITLMTEVG